MRDLKGTLILPTPPGLERRLWAKTAGKEKLLPLFTFLLFFSLSVGRVVGMNAKKIYQHYPDLPGNSELLQDTRFFGRRRDIAPVLIELMGLNLFDLKEGDLERLAFLLSDGLKPQSKDNQRNTEEGED